MSVEKTDQTLDRKIGQPLPLSAVSSAGRNRISMPRATRDRVEETKGLPTSDPSMSAGQRGFSRNSGDRCCWCDPRRRPCKRVGQSRKRGWQVSRSRTVVMLAARRVDEAYFAIDLSIDVDFTEIWTYFNSLLLIHQTSYDVGGNPKDTLFQLQYKWTVQWAKNTILLAALGGLSPSKRRGRLANAIITCRLACVLMTAFGLNTDDHVRIRIKKPRKPCAASEDSQEI